MITKTISSTDSQVNNEEKDLELIGLEIQILYPDVEEDLIGLGSVEETRSNNGEDSEKNPLTNEHELQGTQEIKLENKISDLLYFDSYNKR